ncbi:asparagine synthetase B family protein [Vibrio ordalii]|uniref:asparagine synthetase B family protein n=1 Tax=Vibrio ordalii TaxID=28174 RepID=UPI000248347E|nr:asparagine synthase (glutamine-hydrolyzing) [Vibrio ordalii]
MCGIAGYIFSGVLDKSNLKKMTDSIIHRGPDGEGHYYGDGFFFGHRRLAIVDLTEHGKQPMLYQDRYIITFNGEIYNYIEIKKELIDVGYRFNNDTDTEVIMAAYDYWGVNCLDRFNGMWAFVLYDKKEDCFFYIT